MTALGTDTDCLSIPVFLVVERTAILDPCEELLREEVELLEECHTVQSLRAHDHQILDSDHHTHDDECEERHRDQKLENSESLMFISRMESCDHRDER